MNAELDHEDILLQALKVIVPNASGHTLLSTRHHIVSRVKREGERALIVKLAAKQEGSTLASECLTIRQLQPYFPVPRLLTPAPVTVLDEAQYILMEDEGEENIFDAIRRRCSTRHALLQQMGECLRRLHRVELTEQVTREIALAGEGRRQRLQHVAQRVKRNGELPARLVDRFLKESWPEAHGLAICHGDYHAVQCIVDEGCLAAVVDWHSARIDSPCVDYGVSRTNLALYCDAEEIGAFDAGYFAHGEMPREWNSAVRASTLSQCLALMDSLRDTDSKSTESPLFRKAARLFREVI